ncbi:MAG: hypothetical protein M3384_17640 [Acidobacteriota bacterium]|nr:hypothetical protein [Acidobacteriota bacterium]
MDFSAETGKINVAEITDKFKKSANNLDKLLISIHYLMALKRGNRYQLQRNLFEIEEFFLRAHLLSAAAAKLFFANNRYGLKASVPARENSNEILYEKPLQILLNLTLRRIIFEPVELVELCSE